MEALFAAVREDFGSVNGLINNAGTNRDALLVKVKDGKVQDKMSLAEPALCGTAKARLLCGNQAEPSLLSELGGHRGDAECARIQLMARASRSMPVTFSTVRLPSTTPAWTTPRSCSRNWSAPAGASV